MVQKQTKSSFKSFFARIPLRAYLAVGIVCGLMFIIYFSVGWYFSSKLLNVKPQTVNHDQMIITASGGKYTTKGNAYDIEGIVGLIRKDGSYAGILSKPISKDHEQQTSVRSIESTNGEKLEPGDNVSLQGNIWTTDPKKALGIDFRTVRYESELGPMSAWLIPAQGVANANTTDRWTVLVHGIGADKQEMLRFIKPVQATGSNVLVINYRGDKDNPAETDNFTHLGDTEWKDLESAVEYAKRNGARDIRLFGSSLGGSITENYLRRSKNVESTNISRVVLDSPALDWDQTLALRVKNMGYPSIIRKPGMTVASMRAGIDFKRISTKPEQIKHRTLINHSEDDKSVPQQPSKNLSEARPELVSFYDFKTGGHIRSWNTDAARYESTLKDFLQN